MGKRVMDRRGFLRLGSMLGAGLLVPRTGSTSTAALLADDDVYSWSRTLKTRHASAEAQVTRGIEKYRGFVLDNVLHSACGDDIHFNLYVPEGYTGRRAAALFVTLPGRQGLYWQGVGTNLQTEDYAFEAQAYDKDMIVVAPQLMDNGETSARQTIELVEWLMGAYDIDRQRVFLEGYSDGGETLSIVMGLRPELFSRALLCSASWEGNMGVLAVAKVPVYMVIGEWDEFYGSEPVIEAASRLAEIYAAQGLSAEKTAELVTLDVKPEEYFIEAELGDPDDQHGTGSALFCRDEQVMGWLFA